MKKKKTKMIYRFAIPVLTLVSVTTAIALWYYTESKFGDSFAGFAPSGRLGEAAGKILSDPVVLLAAAALFFFHVAAAAAVARAVKKKQQGAAFFILLIIINVAVFAAILYAAINAAAA